MLLNVKLLFHHVSHKILHYPDDSLLSVGGYLTFQLFQCWQSVHEAFAFIIFLNLLKQLRMVQMEMSIVNFKHLCYEMVKHLCLCRKEGSSL